MEAMGQSWTDDRLDDGFKRVNERFDEVGRRFDQAEARVDQRFGQVDQRLDRIDVRIESMQAMMERRFDTLQYSLMYAVVGIPAAMAAVLVAVIISQN
jgi:hypothetical protein